MKSPTDNYRPDIDGLRAVAVALVIASHTVPHYVPGGFIGVDVFFVISGFLITRLVVNELGAGSFTLGGFYARRIRRIVPALLLVLVVSALVGWYTLLPGEFRWFGQSLLWCAPFLANAFFARVTGYFDPDADYNVLLHLWSLGVEEQFYLVWPLLLVLAVRYGVRDRMLVAVFVTSLLISAWGARVAPMAHYFQPAPRAWELLAGAILATRTTAFLPLYWRTPASIAGLLLILAGALLLDGGDFFPGLWGALPTGGALLVIAAGAAAPANRGLLARDALVWVGRRSYSLYLWHWPVLAYGRILNGGELTPPLIAAAIGVTVLCGCFSYRVIEEPLRRGAWGAPAVPALLGGLALFTLLGAAVASGTLPGRLSGPAFDSWERAASDWHFPVHPADGFDTLQLRGQLPATTLFIGDSHLQQYWPRIEYLVDSHRRQARSVLIITYPGCPMLPALNVLRQPRHCDRLFDYATEQALRPEVDTVVVGAFWEVYLLGEYALSRQQGLYRPGDPLRRELRLDSAATRTALEELARVLTRLVASGRRVYIVLSNPTSPQFAPLALVPAQLRLSPHEPAVFRADPARSVELDSYEAFVAPLMNRLREVAVRSGAQVIDPAATLCPQRRCPAVGADGTPLYVDSNHLRAAYARTHASFIDQTVLGAPAQQLTVDKQQEQEAACEQRPAQTFAVRSGTRCPAGPRP